MEYILGVIVSLIAQVTKRTVGTDTLGTYAAVLGLSLCAAAVYVTVKDTAMWPTIVQIALTAGAFHNFVVRRFEQEQE